MRIFLRFFRESVKISEISAFSGKIFVYFSPGRLLKKKRFGGIIITIYLRLTHQAAKPSSRCALNVRRKPEANDTSVYSGFFSYYGKIPKKRNRRGQTHAAAPGQGARWRK